jgi:hypothetical protein
VSVLECVELTAENRSVHPATQEKFQWFPRESWLTAVSCERFWARLESEGDT